MIYLRWVAPSFPDEPIRSLPARDDVAEAGVNAGRRPGSRIARKEGGRRQLSINYRKWIIYPLWRKWPHLARPKAYAPLDFPNASTLDLLALSSRGGYVLWAVHIAQPHEPTVLSLQVILEKALCRNLCTLLHG
jgi:hypothetical protein